LRSRCSASRLAWRERATFAAVYVSLSRLRVPRDRAGELVAAFRRRMGAVDGFDGFVDLQVWQSDRDAGELVMVSRWRDRECFKAYMRSAEHRESHDRIDPGLDDAIRLERLEHLHTYEVVAE
jgi:heme-degrading monooxygenase HmoA